MTKAEWIEKNRDGLEERYHQMYHECLQENLESIWDAFRSFENALVDMGILEADQVLEEPEDANDTEHWDEYMLDLKIDLAMDEALLAYEI